MEWMILLSAIILIALFLLKNLTTRTQDYPYEKQLVLFTPAERSFYGVLQQAAQGKAIVFGKVRVADILKTKKGLSNSKRQTAFNQISAKHFDFVLCDPDDLSVLSVVELDDSSHSSKKRKARDDFLEKACEAANLQLHRFKASRNYNIDEVREVLFPEPVVEPGTNGAKPRIEPKLNLEESTSETKSEKLVCPKCSAELVTRVAKRGKNKGAVFLACSRFPECRYIKNGLVDSSV